MHKISINLGLSACQFFLSGLVSSQAPIDLRRACQKANADTCLSLAMQ